MYPNAMQPNMMYPNQGNMQPMHPGQPPFGMNFGGQIEQLNRKVTRLERQMERLEARVRRLEGGYPVPISSNREYENENNHYML